MNIVRPLAQSVRLQSASRLPQRMQTRNGRFLACQAFASSTHTGPNLRTSRSTASIRATDAWTRRFDGT